MPLVFTVLVIIVIVVNLKDHRKKSVRLQKQGDVDLLRTNATLEDKLWKEKITEYMDDDVAYREVLKELGKRGFVPCLPQGWYSVSYSKWEDKYYVTGPHHSAKSTSYATKYTYGVEKYDSEVVKARKQLLDYQGIPLTDENIYTNLPNTMEGYYDEYTLMHKFRKILPIGTIVNIPWEGDTHSGEIIDYKWLIKNSAKGFYIITDFRRPGKTYKVWMTRDLTVLNKNGGYDKSKMQKWY